MRIIDQVTFKINEFFLGYLIYGEPEGLSEEEIAAIDKFINELESDGYDYTPMITKAEAEPYEDGEAIEGFYGIDEIMREYAQCLYVTFNKWAKA